MKHLYLIFTLFIPFAFLTAQQNLEYDKILKIENLKFHENEIRVYKKYSTSTGLELFRFYQDEKENWKAEFYETIASKNKTDEIKIRIRKSKLNSLKNFELIWAQILDTDVNYLPKLEAFRYKLKKNNKDYRVEDGEVIRTYNETLPIDGSIFLVKTKNNQFEYDNPESYLEKYPNVDELLSFKELLDLIRTEFKVFEKE